MANYHNFTLFLTPDFVGDYENILLFAYRQFFFCPGLLFFTMIRQSDISLQYESLFWPSHFGLTAIPLYPLSVFSFLQAAGRHSAPYRKIRDRIDLLSS